MMGSKSNQKLIKTTEAVSSLDGATKAAMLYAELGADVTEPMLSLFTNKEIKRLKSALKRLRTYNVRQEIVVLEQALDYGERKGIVPKTKKPESTLETRASQLRSSAGSDPSSMAALIRSWISNEK